MNKKRIAVIVGSLRKESYNRKMAKNLITLAPESLDLEIVEIGHLSMYNQDFDENPPADWVAFRDQIRSFDGVLFVSPEYNRSVPGVLKNAIDVGSRPYGKSAWDGKPAGIVTVSIGDVGGFGANHHLRQMLTFLNMPALQQPEMYIGHGAGLFDEMDALKSEKTRDFAKAFIEKFAAWVDKISEEESVSSARQAPGAQKGESLNQVTH